MRQRLLDRYSAFVNQRDQQLVERLKQNPDRVPFLTISTLLSYGFAISIHSFTVVLLLLGIASLTSQWAGFCSIPYGLILVGLAVVLRPRLFKPDDTMLSPADVPTLYRVVNEIAAEMKAHPIQQIGTNDDKNAYYARAGFRQQPMIVFGKPLLLNLKPQERVALIAHELAHDVNHDARRGLIIGSSHNTLVAWFQILLPDADRAGILMALARIPMRLLAQLVYWLLQLFYQLLLYQSRRAEYLADYRASTVAGTEATISLLNVFGYEDRPLDLFKRTHPSINRRMQFIESITVQPPRCVLSDSDSHQIDLEFQVLETRAQERIWGAYRQNNPRRKAAVEQQAQDE